MVQRSEFDRLRTTYGKDLLPLLAENLSNPDLKSNALFAMDEIDSVGATPYKLRNLVNESGDFQTHTFGTANLAMMQFELQVRRGDPSLSPDKSIAYYPVNSAPYPYRKAIHDAAVAVLLKRLSGATDIDTLQSPRTVGLTGTRKDIPLLRKYLKKFSAPQIFGYDQMLMASMARLGDRASFKAIENGINAPVPRILVDPYQQYEGVRPLAKGDNAAPARKIEVAEPGSGQKFREWADAAAFTLDRRFIPMLLSHLDDARGQSHGDYADASPADHACAALSKIVLWHQGDGTVWGVAEWKAWALKNPQLAIGHKK